MKSNLNFFFLIVLSFLILNCTVQKRTFNKGYFVQWNFKQKINSKNNNEQKLEEEQSQIEEINTELSLEHGNLPSALLNIPKTEKIELKYDISSEKKDLTKNFETNATKLIYSKTPLESRIKNKKNTIEIKEKKKRSKFEKAKIYIFIGLALFLIGLVFLFNSFAATHIVGGAFLFGMLFFVVGIILFFLSLFRIIAHSLKNRLEKNIASKDDLQKKRKRITLIVGIISLIFLVGALLLSIFSQLSILYPIFVIAGFSFLIFSIIFFFTK